MTPVLITCFHCVRGAAATDDVIGDLATGLHRVGRPVTVLCARSDIDHEEPGITVVRLNGGDAKGFYGRLRYFAQFLEHVTRYRAQYGVFITTDEPPLLRLLLAISKNLTAGNALNVAWVMDLPEGRRKLHPTTWFGSLVRRVIDGAELRGLRSADRVVVLGQCMAQYLTRTGIPQDRIETIGIWPNVSVSSPLAAFAESRLSILYSGHFGPWHDWQTLLPVLSSLQKENVLFRFAGVGVGIDSLKSYAAERDLTNVIFEARVPKESALALLGSADVHLVTLRPEAAGTCVPSKLYAAMAIGRAIIFIGPRSSQAAVDVEAARAGFVIENGDPAALERAVRTLAADRNHAKQLGLNGYEWFLRNRSRNVAVNQWNSLIASLAPEQAVSFCETVQR